MLDELVERKKDGMKIPWVGPMKAEARYGVKVNYNTVEDYFKNYY